MSLSATVSEDIYSIRTADDEKNQFEKKPEMDVPKVEVEVVDVAQRLVENYPDIGALVFECLDLPPFAGAVQAAVNLPIFDFISLINMVYSVVVKQSYPGFM